MSQYSAAVPSDGQVKPAIKAFFERFYKISDTPDGHENYADQFTPDGKLIMGLNEVNGRDGEQNDPGDNAMIDGQTNKSTAIIKMRHAMWEKVAKRSHKPAQLYSFGAGSNDIMLFGTVDYTLKDGKGTTVDWAARAHFVGEGDDLKMDVYQVYLVSLNRSQVLAIGAELLPKKDFWLLLMHVRIPLPWHALSRQLVMMY
jgi:hypothetical protein